MKITVKEFNTYKNVSSKLLKAVKERINEIFDDEHNCFEDDFEFNINDVNYGVTLIEEPEFTVDGKYQSRSISYQLVSYDTNIQSYVCDSNIIDKYNLFFEIFESRTGSYYTDYYYSYEKPDIFRAKLVHIPEQIIPAHDNIEFDDIDEE